MTDYRRPWWLFVNKPPGLITTVQTEFRPDGQRFIIRGEPHIQGLAWLTWGPVGALVVIILLTGLAIALDVKEQSLLMRGLFIILFLGLPVLTWLGATIVTNQLSKKYLQAERDHETRECLIWLKPTQSQFLYRTNEADREEQLTFADIRQVKVAPPIGARDKNAACLMLDTAHGPRMLLNEALGTQSQKLDLAREIQQMLKSQDGDAA